MQFFISHGSVKWLGGFPGVLAWAHSCGCNQMTAGRIGQGDFASMSGSWCYLLVEMSWFSFTWLLSST